MDAWHKADKDGDGAISRAEFDAMARVSVLPEANRAEIFNRLDKDGDGSLARKELGKFSKSRDDKPMKRLWELDADHSGGISFEEFKAGQLFQKLPPEKMEKIFRRLDTDGDGVITPKDRPEPPFGGKKHHRQDKDSGPDRPGPKLDADGDGFVTFAEFRASPTSRDLTEDEQEDRFEALDKDRDHKLSPDELSQGRPDGGKRRPEMGKD